jgi:polysaccharide chain length determinant protein (PEP-CTERM system associated)
MNNIYEEVRIALHNVWKRRWLALIVAWLVSLLGWLVISMIPNKYESTASVFVQTQTHLADQLGITANERKNSIDGITQTLTSVENLEKVVRGTDLSQQVSSPREVTDAAVGLRKTIKVVALQDNLFEITASSGDGGLSNGQNAKLAKDIVQKLLDLFVEGNLSSNRVDVKQSMTFYDAQIQQREQQLQEAEAKRVAFETKYMGLLPGVGSVSQRMEAARAELGQVDSNLMAAQGALAAINGQASSIPPSINTPGSLVGGGGGRSAAIEGQIADGIARGWTNDHPDMLALRRQLAGARASDRGTGPRMTAGTSTPNPAYITLRSMLAEKQAAVGALGARKAQLQAEMLDYQSKQVAEPGIAAEQSRINRDYEVLKAQYDKLLADREEVKLRGSLQSDTDSIRFRVIEPPSAPRSPSAPNRPLLLTMVLLAGLIAGAGAAFGMSQIRTSYATAGRLERASGLPVIGSISEVASPLQRTVRRQKLKYFAGATTALAGAWVLLLVVEFVQRGMVA